jgi:hypothetical protein
MAGSQDMSPSVGWSSDRFLIRRKKRGGIADRSTGFDVSDGINMIKPFIKNKHYLINNQSILPEASSLREDFSKTAPIRLDGKKRHPGSP